LCGVVQVAVRRGEVKGIGGLVHRGLLDWLIARLDYR